MADNTTLAATSGGDVIATDDIPAASGVASGAKVQRVKVGWGVDAAYADANLTTPLPVAPQPFGTVLSGRKTTTAAAAIAASTACASVTVKALSGNTSAVYVGPTGVTASNGLELMPGDAVSLDVSNLSAVFILPVMAGEGITYLATV